jgi:hypothetical protein
LRLICRLIFAIRWTIKDGLHAFEELAFPEHYLRGMYWCNFAISATVLRPLIESKATFDLKVALNERLFFGINTLLGGIPKT